MIPDKERALREAVPWMRCSMTEAEVGEIDAAAAGERLRGSPPSTGFFYVIAVQVFFT